MSYEVYKVMHLLGVFLVLGGLTGYLGFYVNGGTTEQLKFRFQLALTHGLGMVLSLVGGFGLLARLGMTGGLPNWAIAKLVIWLIFGALMVPTKRKPSLAKVLWLFVPLLGAVAAYLAINKPF